MTPLWDHGPQALLQRVEQVRRELLAAIGKTSSLRLHNQWSVRDRQLVEIGAEGTRQPEVAISLVGGTGAGKSTLVNALLDVRLLPVSSMKAACTAAISEVSYAATLPWRLAFAPCVGSARSQPVGRGWWP